MNGIVIGFAGDVMIGRGVNAFLDQAPPVTIWGDLIDELKNTDLNMVNLEAALTHSEKIVPKVFNFKADPSKVAVLKEAHIDVVNLANNHVLDYDTPGLLETLQTLDEAKIVHVGAGKDLSDARKPVILERKGIKIGILGYSDNEPSWLAQKDRPGIAYIQVGDLTTVLEDIAPLKQKVDIRIVSLHWGPNMRERPTPAFVNFAHQLIDAGVDIIHGHSAHIFQGVEEYHGGLILYDTGDFVDDYYVDPLLRNDLSFFFRVKVSKKGYESLELIPTRITNYRVNKAKPKDAERILQRMRLLSSEFSTVITALPEIRP